MWFVRDTEKTAKEKKIPSGKGIFFFSLAPQHL